MLGFGSVGQAVLPLLLRHLALQPAQVLILSASAEGAQEAAHFGVELRVRLITEKNHLAQLEPLLREGDFLLNLSVDVSSLALLSLCERLGVLYLDTCIEPWAGGYTDTRLTLAERSNYALREQALASRPPGRGPTAVLTQGANPGLVSSFVKQALLNLAADQGWPERRSNQPAGWAQLACDLGVRAIHIAERDTQVANKHRMAGEFVNTWSVAGFVAEGTQPSELGWGSHERHWPADAARHASGCGAAIYLRRPGMATRVHSWTPRQGPYQGFLVTHGESISLADFLTLRQAGQVLYRPTVHYAYQPCDDALLSIHELAGRQWQPQIQRRILREQIVSGEDELGVLLMGHARGAYWYGSRLSIEQARSGAPYNSATSLQVAAGVLAGMVWALQHPDAGVVEPEHLDHEAVLAIARPYLGDLAGHYSDWTPLQNRQQLFAEPLDHQDPWQFCNIRVS
jgi:homospermidine synthase